MYKNLIIISLLVLSITGVSGLYIIDHTNSSVASARWQAIGQTQQVSDDIEEVERVLSSQIESLTDLANDLTLSFEAYQETSSSDLASGIKVLEEAQASYDSSSAVIVEEQEALVRRVNILEEETTPSLELLKQINKIKNDLIIFNTRLDDAEEKLLDIPPLPW